MLLSPGTRLGPYEIVAPLGAGGMGEVHRARDTRLSRDVAIKVLPTAFAADPERLVRFTREAQALASLNHPNIAAIYGLEETGGSPCLVLELVEGETLSARLARGALPPREAVALGLQVAAALEAAHERGVVHRDIKPGNVMLTRANVAKVLDFGLARIDAARGDGGDSDESPTVTADAGATRAGAILGTTAYMSPEQARGLPVDRRSDVWSFGCVLYECLAGAAAFQGGTVSDLVARILEREPDWSALPAGTPARVRELLRRCLRKDVDARPRDIRDVRLELAEVAAGRAEGGEGHEKSVAVLPFENLSAADDEYFADGVTDEILNALAHVDGLRVAARTSCFAFKGRREDLRSVGEKLDVTTVLEGSVRRSGSRLRITAQLVNVADGYQLWSERYDRELTDVFEVQEEIATAITSRLRGTLHEDAARGRARHGTRNLEAYELLLRGRSLHTKRGRFLREAGACFERAIALDPGYAEAMAWLSDSYRVTGTFGGVPSGQIMPMARDMAERALAIDDRQVEAWVALACVAEQYEWDHPRAARMWKRVFEIDPRHARGRGQRAVWGYAAGVITTDEALAETLRAVQDDPLNAWVGGMRSYMLGFAGQHAESIAEAERSLAVDAESFFAHWNLLRAFAWAGDHDRAFGIAPALLNDSGRHPWVLGVLAWTFGKAGQVERARAVHEEMLGRSRHEFLSPIWLAVAAASGGLAEEATRIVERAVKERDPIVIWSRVNPVCDGLRALPRFAEVTRGVWA